MHPYTLFYRCFCYLCCHLSPPTQSFEQSCQECLLWFLSSMACTKPAHSSVGVLTLPATGWSAHDEQIAMPGGCRAEQVGLWGKLCVRR